MERWEESSNKEEEGGEEEAPSDTLALSGHPDVLLPVPLWGAFSASSGPICAADVTAGAWKGASCTTSRLPEALRFLGVDLVVL
jgi:hypothetical protein